MLESINTILELAANDYAEYLYLAGGLALGLNFGCLLGVSLTERQRRREIEGTV